MATRKKKTSIYRKTRKAKANASHYSISGPYVVNLPDRKDRWSQFSKQASKLKIKPIRIDGIYNKVGYTGCSKAHINALKQWSGEDAIWICEDDCEFIVNSEVLHKTIDAFMKSPGDVLCLGYSSSNQKHYDKIFDQTINCNAACSYIVKGHFVKKLLNVWEDSLKGTKSPLFSIYKKLKIFKGKKKLRPFEIIDQSWKILQQDYIFLIPKNRCAVQTKSFSDTQKKLVNYKH